MFWLVMGGSEYILAGGAWWCVVVLSDGEYILAGGGWWWLVVDIIWLVVGDGSRV